MSYRDFRHPFGCGRFPEICQVAAVMSMAVASGAVAQPVTEDARDAAIIVPALNRALENERSGKEVTWSNAATGRTGTIRIERTFYRGQQPCRDYTRRTSGAAAAYEVQGVGCRLGKMNWGIEETRLENPATKPSAAPADPAAKPGPAPVEPDATAARGAGAGDPPGDATSPRPLRKPTPPQPVLRYSLPTRSQP